MRIVIEIEDGQTVSARSTAPAAAFVEGRAPTDRWPVATEGSDVASAGAAPAFAGSAFSAPPDVLARAAALHALDAGPAPQLLPAGGQELGDVASQDSSRISSIAASHEVGDSLGHAGTVASPVGTGATDAGAAPRQ